MNFEVLWLYVKFCSAKFGAWHPLVWQKRAIRKSFLHENHIFHQICESFFPRKFPAIQYMILATYISFCLVSIACSCLECKHPTCISTSLAANSENPEFTVNL